MVVYQTIYRCTSLKTNSLNASVVNGHSGIENALLKVDYDCEFEALQGYKSMGTKINGSKGFSLIELLIVVAIILIIAAIAIPNLLRSRMAANQAAAVATLRNINNSQATYISTFSALGYADTFVKLGPGAPCDFTHACLVDEIIGCAAQPCTKSGYNYFIASTSAAPPIVDYRTTASPLSWASTGSENFCSMNDGILRKEVAPNASLAAIVSVADCSDTTKYVAVQ
jgi:type IV pilus assembly protein PilA